MAANDKSKVQEQLGLVQAQLKHMDELHENCLAKIRASPAEPIDKAAVIDNLKRRHNSFRRSLANIERELKLLAEMHD